MNKETEVVGVAEKEESEYVTGEKERKYARETIMNPLHTIAIMKREDLDVVAGLKPVVSVKINAGYIQEATQFLTEFAGIRGVYIHIFGDDKPMFITPKKNSEIGLMIAPMIPDEDEE